MLTNARCKSINSRRQTTRNGARLLPAIGLAKARLDWMSPRGETPILDRNKIEEPTFGECADIFLESIECQWRNNKHRAQWHMTLKRYAAPIRGKLVSEVDTDDVLSVLKPVRETKPETASRLRGRIERVMVSNGQTYSLPIKRKSFFPMIG